MTTQNALRGFGEAGQNNLTQFINTRRAARRGEVKHETHTSIAPLSFGGEVGYRHALGNIDSSRDLAFNSGGGAFTVEGAPLDQSAVIVGTTIKADLAQEMDFTVGYQGAFAPDSRTHQPGRLNLAF